MLVETRTISPVQYHPVQVNPTRSKGRFGNFHKKRQLQRIKKQTSSYDFDAFDSFEKEEPMYDGHCRTILFHLSHIGSIVDLYV
ncbi:MAG: hypothetical protein HQK75_14370 [Candidatus Magnetomorum sp.]|nr:hypothetical protein [Candidatus Magnetomorum sp.]